MYLLTQFGFLRRPVKVVLFLTCILGFGLRIEVPKVEKLGKNNRFSAKVKPSGVSLHWGSGVLAPRDPPPCRSQWAENIFCLTWPGYIKPQNLPKYFSPDRGIEIGSRSWFETFSPTHRCCGAPASDQNGRKCNLNRFVAPGHAFQKQCLVVNEEPRYSNIRLSVIILEPP